MLSARSLYECKPGSLPHAPHSTARLSDRVDTLEPARLVARRSGTYRTPVRSTLALVPRSIGGDHNNGSSDSFVNATVAVVAIVDVATVGALPQRAATLWRALIASTPRAHGVRTTPSRSTWDHPPLPPVGGRARKFSPRFRLYTPRRPSNSKSYSCSKFQHLVL